MADRFQRRGAVAAAPAINSITPDEVDGAVAVAPTTPALPVPPPLPTFTPVEEQTASIPLTPAPGFVLTTINPTTFGRGRANLRGVHLCKAGEGYVLDEELCEVDDKTGHLLFNGDVVGARSAEGHAAFESHRQKKARQSRGDKRQLERDMKARAAQDGERITIKDLDPDEFGG